MGKREIYNGADALVASLVDLGVRCIFGLPGTQNVGLFEALRSSEIHAVQATSETTAGFMANGWFRASGQPGVFIAINGPGFAWSVPPLAEAALDSTAVLFITGKPPDRGYKNDLQVIEQREIATALGCKVFDIDELESLEETLRQAWAAATANGPRPVVLQVAAAVLGQDWTSSTGNVEATAGQSDSPVPTDELVAFLAQARRPVVMAGGGTLDHDALLEQLLDVTGAAFFTTPTARGVIREDHPMCLRADLLSDDVDVLNRFLEKADVIISLGCRFSHNGTGGFTVALAEENLVHVDADSNVLVKNYPARWSLCMDVGDFLSTVCERLPAKSPEAKPAWPSSDIEGCREELSATRQSVLCEPSWNDAGNCGSLFRQIREGTPDNGIIVTDTGLHQILTRTHFDVLSPRGLIFPSDFQSMGFGLPAAIGAALAAPDRPVVALIGDGSLLMVGAELLAAKREAVSLPVLVFRDGALGQIRLQQIQEYGHESATKLEPFDLAEYSNSLGIRHVRADVKLADQLRQAMGECGPTVIEVELQDNDSLAEIRKKVKRKNSLKSALGPRATQLLKRLRG